MRKCIESTILLAAVAIAPALRAAPPLASLAAIHKLSNQDAAAHVPVDFDATVTFYRTYEGTLFVQDGDTAIYVQPSKTYKLSQGDRIHIHGTTRESFRPFVANADITVLGHAPLPDAPLASFDALIHGQYDCRFVKLRGRVISADITISSDRPSTTLQLMTDGGSAEIEIESDNRDALNPLVDAEVEISGSVSGRFDGKMEMTGIVLHTQSMAQVKIVKPQQASPWTTPLTPMNEIMTHYRVINQSSRVRVRGTVTYFIPGSAVVLQDGSESI